ncbi:tRNA methyltransferase 10 homolog B isoform X4 [Pan troglodytes]|uniref:tRNA methyltransferase 10 homolog B isoform X4 n=1 Tax=Pan troglodytes TaxID=9598 RepID=UPI0005123CB0|nr:tRNA methyltransferase 10 homolog B isoform X4 [Pan troglodytes]
MDFLKASSFCRSMRKASARRERSWPQAVRHGARKMSRENRDTGKRQLQQRRAKESKKKNEEKPIVQKIQELSRLAGQIRRLYGSNKKADRPFWICLTGFTTDSPLYEECVRMNDGFSSYLLDITEEDCFSLFPLETLVYLTPDSEHALEDVDLNKVYILGGLVDESIQKKVTFQKAREYSVKTARLPIQEYMVRNQNGKNYHSEILAINQVFDILSTYLETHNWPEALKKGVSSGKGYILRNSVE